MLLTIKAIIKHAKGLSGTIYPALLSLKYSVKYQYFFITSTGKE